MFINGHDEKKNHVRLLLLQVKKSAFNYAITYKIDEVFILLLVGYEKTLNSEASQAPRRSATDVKWQLHQPSMFLDKDKQPDNVVQHSKTLLCPFF